MKQFTLFIFIFLSLEGYGQEAKTAKKPRHKFYFFFNGINTESISRKDFIASLNDTAYPLTFALDTPIKYEILHYNISFVSKNEKEKPVEEYIKGKGSEIKKIIEPFKKDLSDVKSIIFSDVTIMGPTGTVKVTNGPKIEFKE